MIHIGWSGIDGKSEYAWWQKEGIEFYTPDVLVTSISIRSRHPQLMAASVVVVSVAMASAAVAPVIAMVLVITVALAPERQTSRSGHRW